MKKANEKKVVELFEKSSECVNALVAIPDELKRLSDELEKVIEAEAANGTESEAELNRLREGVSNMRKIVELLGMLGIKE